MKRYKRFCENCKKKYQPKDKHGKLCDDCKEEARGNGNIKRIKTWKKKI